jgi:hypothetical protein
MPVMGYDQRVLNELQRIRLLRNRMIWLLPYPSPSPVSNLDRTCRKTEKRDNLLCWWERGEGAGEEPNLRRQREILSGEDIP